MRTWVIALAVTLGSLALAPAGGDATAARPRRRVPTHDGALLPAPVTITEGRATFRIAPDGRLRRVAATPLPFPRDAAWFPADDAWFAIRRRHLVVGRLGQTLWRSREQFPAHLSLDVVIVRGGAIAFSYGVGAGQRLYVAHVGAPERLVARGEFPLGWTSGGFFTYRFRGRELRLRSVAGALLDTVARRPLEYAYDGSGQSLYFVAGRTVMRAHGTAVAPVVSLARLGLAGGSSLMTQPIGGLLELLEGRRLIVLRPDGSIFAEALVPRGHNVDSQIAVAPDAKSIAFTTSFQLRAAQPNRDPARGGVDLETVYLLRAGAQATVPLHREPVQFAPCLGGASVQWRGSWLLFSAGEGNLAAIDTAGARRVVELTARTHDLPGPPIDAGFSAYWGTGPPAQ
jgi:hypothetical protein